MPIDFIKAEIIDISQSIISDNPLLTFICKVNMRTGEISEHKEAYYKNFKIQIFKSGRIWLSGSIHTFYNDGKHNYNDLNQSCFKRALKQLKSDLRLEPKNLKILNLEWGFNLSPPTNTNYILDRTMQHLSSNKTVGIDCKSEGKYTQFKHSSYILKLYNKGLQYKLDAEVLRIEIKQTNWSKYRAKGIYSLDDFIKCDKKLFFNELINQWSNVIFYDIDNSITKKHIEYQTTVFWDEKKKNNSRKSKKYHFDKLKKLNKSIGFDNQSKIIELLKSKSDELQA